MSNVDVTSGRTIAGRYRLRDQLGSGGMGSVWRADDLTLGAPVAVKLIDPALAADVSVSARFYQEAKAAAALRSPHVVQILEYGVDEGIPFIAMELLEGESLAERIHRVRTLHPTEVARIFGDVARAVRRAHEAGIVHRDLKPENIFLVWNDDQEIAKVLDFGIAKTGQTLGGGIRATQAGALIGTPPYMSPEQARGAPVDFRTDLWSLGVIAFECLCGRLPFTAQAQGELILQICSHPIPVPSQVASVPPGFDAWFAQAVDRDPDARFQSAKDMADALRPILTPVAPDAPMGAVAPRAAPALAAPAPLAAPPAQAGKGGLVEAALPAAAVAPMGGLPPSSVAAPEGRVGTMNGGSAFVSGLDARPRTGPYPRPAVLAGVAAMAVVAVVALVWLGVGRAPAPTASASAVPAADTVEATRLTANPDPAPAPVEPSGPVVSPADPAPLPAQSPPKGGGKPAAPPAPKPAAPVTPPVTPKAAEPAPPKPAAPDVPKPAEPPAAKPADKPGQDKKKKDRIGF